MPKLKDHTGKRTGRLTVVKRLLETCPKRGTLYLCHCDCGNDIKYYSAEINHKYKPRLSCGFCAPSKDFPMEWQSYSHMLDRCYNISSEAFKHYGGRGINVCSQWKDSFYVFLADMGKRPTKFHSIERVNNELGYSRENCRWAMQFEQLCNTRNSYCNKL